MKIEVTYTLTRPELLAFFKYATRPTRRSMILGWVCTLAGTAFLLWLGLTDIRDRFGNIQILRFESFFIVLACGLVLYGFVGMPIAIRRMAGRLGNHPNSAELLGELRITLTAEGFHANTPRQETVYKWHAFERIVRHEGMTYLMLTPGMGIVLPDRAFEDDDQRDTALRAIEQFRKESRPFETACPKCGYDLCEATSQGCPECGWQPEKETLQE